ncbi:unnamed protein product [Ectocarpus sp. CCAP 1310/34]|nr:unnamed protein product [Ectocarpus sp. CCAP 1310/34]
MDTCDLRHAGEEAGELVGSFSPVVMRRMFEDGQVPGEDVRAGAPTDRTASDEDGHVDDETFDCCPAEVCLSAVASAVLQDHLGKLERSADDIMEQMLASVMNHLDQTCDWMLPMWEKVKTLQPTRELIVCSWGSLLNLLENEKKNKPSTRTATAFTLKRFDTWEKRLRAWIEHDAIQEVAHTEKGDAARRTLSCICNTIDEGGDWVLSRVSM